MENKKELRLEWTTQTGCCGLAARTGKTALGDMAEYRGKEYASILYPMDQQPRWGLTEEQWSFVRDLGSVVSIPLFASNKGDRVIGVLNIDARVGLAEWLPESQQEEFLIRVQQQRGLLAWALEIGE